ncbi:MAG TPA: phospholipase D family protein, partial [Povalibacter sp.]|nr:phospholipase D family protein [Povalibacter sp.]
AQRTLDLQYYIWHSDPTGQYLAHEVLLAADRGVRVRMLLDDMDARSRDGLLMAIDQHPQIEIRLFNPFATRSGMLRTLRELFRRGSRLNHRMHNKAWIADGRLAIVGGRNVGDEYFSASAGVNFVDLDATLAGAVVEKTERIFDQYWNSDGAVPIARLRRTARNRLTLDEVRRQLTEGVRTQVDDLYARRLRESPQIQDLLAGRCQLTWANEVEVVADDPRKALKSPREIDPGVLESIEAGFAATERELLVISPYFVPGPGGTAALRRLALNGRHVAVLTNSLAATDVAAVHSGYSRYREPLLEAGVKLHELKPGPDESEDEHNPRMRLGSSKASLHTKAAVVDREHIFVGSFNLDPRSATLNCEMGVWIRDHSLGQELATLFELGASPQRSFTVTLDERSELAWTEQLNGRAVRYDHDPYAGWGRRCVTWLLRYLPIESLL